MFLLYNVVFVVLLQSTTGDDFCSLNDTNIECVPCDGNCTALGLICYLCPKQCGKHNNCKTVCEPTCHNRRCEYVVSDSVPVCTQGCIEGFTGQQCQEYCPEGCKECDQESGKHCTSCMAGLEGDNCNKTIVSSESTVPSHSSIMRECSEKCEFCKDDDVVCAECTNDTMCQDSCGCNELRLTTDSKQYPESTATSFDETKQLPTGEVTEASGYTIYVVGILSALFATLCTGIVFVCYHRHMKGSCVPHRPCGRDRTTNHNSDGSSFTHTGYTYIDETNLGSCHDRTNVRPINVPRCSGVDYYEEMGNRLSLAEENNGSESSGSAWSGTLFGNLFEDNNESDTQSHLTISEGQLNENIDLVVVYEINCLNYITPEVTIHANQGVSDV